MANDENGQDEFKALLRACAEALEKHDIETATRLWRELLDYSTLRFTRRD